MSPKTRIRLQRITSKNQLIHSYLLIIINYYQYKFSERKERIYSNRIDLPEILYYYTISYLNIARNSRKFQMFR